MTKSQPVVPIDATDSTFLQTLFGGLSVSIFIIVWLGSLFSPLILYISIQSRDYVAASILFTVGFIAYVPFWDTKGPLPSAIKYFYSTYHPRYYKRCKVIFKDSLPCDTSSSTSSAHRPAFYAVHPHGAFSLGWSVLYASDFMESVRFCFSPSLFMSPFFKIFSSITGNPGTADKKSMISYMKNGENLALPPGGFEEATISCLDQDRVYIKKRAGFVKLCLQHGYSVVPVYCFGEKDTFWNVQGSWSLRLKINSFGVPAILIWGTKLLPLLPRRSSKYGLMIVAGDRIDLPKIENPTNADVKNWHDKYMASLLAIFEEYKFEAYGDGAKTMKLELW
jgi:2-acylglycerol O-acyltransferase 2